MSDNIGTAKSPHWAERGEVLSDEKDVTVP